MAAVPSAPTTPGGAVGEGWRALAGTARSCWGHVLCSIKATPCPFLLSPPERVPPAHTTVGKWIEIDYRLPARVRLMALVLANDHPRLISA